MLSSPKVEGVRLATLEDLHRISIVAAAAFFWSPSFRFQRPLYKDFPADTIASYWLEYEAAINDPTSVVLVAEDFLEPKEADHVYEALRLLQYRPSPGSRGIVGVCSLDLKPNSCYAGHFCPASKHVSTETALCKVSQNLAGHDSPADQLQRHDWMRDRCVKALEVYKSATNPLKLKYLAGKMRLSTLAVSPAYWRRGHATRMVRFCTQLADLDEAVVGISATAHGAIVAAKAGFKECETFRMERLGIHEQRACEDPPEAADVLLWFGVRLPRNKSPFSITTSQSESPNM